MTACTVCNDTGKLPGSDYMDCSCSAATERAALEAYIASLGGVVFSSAEAISSLVWSIHQRARQIEREAQDKRFRELGDAAVAVNNQHVTDLEAQAARIKSLEKQLQDHSAQAFSIGETYANALSRITELEDRLHHAEAVLRMADYCGDREQQPEFWKSQRKMIERAIIGLRDGWATRKDADDALVLMAAAPQVADTDKVREAAFADTSEVPYLIFYDDQDKPTETVIGHDRAAYRFQQISGNWNAHLYVKIASNSRDCKWPNAKLATDMASQVPVREVPEVAKFMDCAKAFAQAHINSDDLDARVAADLDAGTYAVTNEEHYAMDDAYNTTKAALVAAYRALPAAPVQQEGEKP